MPLLTFGDLMVAIMQNGPLFGLLAFAFWFVYRTRLQLKEHEQHREDIMRAVQARMVEVPFQPAPLGEPKPRPTRCEYCGVTAMEIIRLGVSLDCPSCGAPRVTR